MTWTRLSQRPGQAAGAPLRVSFSLCVFEDEAKNRGSTGPAFSTVDTTLILQNLRNQMAGTPRPLVPGSWVPSLGTIAPRSAVMAAQHGKASQGIWLLRDLLPAPPLACTPRAWGRRNTPRLALRVLPGAPRQTTLGTQPRTSLGNEQFAGQGQGRDGVLAHQGRQAPCERRKQT